MSARYIQFRAPGKGFEWVAYKVCPDCGCTWQGIFADEAERRGWFGPVAEQCPDCEMEDEAGA